MRNCILATLLIGAAGCASLGLPGVPAGEAVPVRAAEVPPMDTARGPLAIRVMYPRAGALVEARDSTFIFGSVGDGTAALRINGMPVTVHPNGTFIAFLPLPRADSAFVLEADAQGTTARQVHRVALRTARAPLPLDGPLRVDSASVAPAGTLLLPGAEPVRVAVRAPRNATVHLRLADTLRLALASAGALPDGGRYDDAEQFARDVPARMLARGGTLEIARARDTVRLRVGAVAIIPDTAPRWVVLAPEARASNDSDRVVSARPTPGGTNRWLLLPGTRLELTGQTGEQSRVRLDDRLQGWITNADVQWLPEHVAAPRRVARSVRLVSDSAWVEVVIPMNEPPAYLVEAEGDRLSLTLYDTRSEIDNVRYLPPDDMVSLLDWRQESDRRLVVYATLRQPLLGHHALWRDGAFVLRLRRVPAIDRDAPLRGLTIAVDAGHPPGGATGPSGLVESDAVLAISERLQRLLESRGATVVMTRTTRDAVGLYDRQPVARRAGAHALVSIHLNALPDGVNPFTAHGTSTYFFHPLSAPLARAVQEGMVAHLGLRDLGVFRGDLALVRPPWMPSVLCEGAFIMIPEQEWLVRTAEGQEAYARGVADGLARFFAELGARR